MKRFVILLALMALLIGAAIPVLAQECEDEIGCVVVGPDDPITIAYMLTISGATSSLGQDSLGGIELAIAARDGELLGHEIELVGEDSLCSSEGGQAAGQRLAADESIVGIIGSSCSSEAVAALPILSEAGMLMISPSNTGPRLTNDDPDLGEAAYMPGYFRTAHNDLFQGAVAAQFAWEVLGATTVATIHDGSPYADGLQQAMADAFIELGGEVVFQGAVNVGDTDMSAILTEIAATAPDVIYLPIFEPESNFIVQQVQDISGLEDVALMSADGSFADTFPENTGDASVGMYLSGPAVSGEAYDEFLAMWDEEIGGVPPSGFHAHAYDAANMLFAAIEAVAVETEDGGLLIGRQALRDAIADTEGFEGLTGLLTCQEEPLFIGDCATGEALAIFQITEEEVAGAWPPAVVWTLADSEMETEE
jgi:branched-chain amino acid transport system substrate-binding protein